MGGDLLLQGGDVLLPDWTLRLADILIRDGEIVEVSPEVVAVPEVRTLDAADMLVMPGFVNSHFHSDENFSPGVYENLPLDVWFVRSMQVTRSEPPSREAIYARTLLGAILMLRSGTTCVVDFLYEAPEITLETLEPVVQAYRDAGLRTTILLGVADKPYGASLPLRDGQEQVIALEGSVPTLQRIIELAHAAVDRWHEPNGLIGIGLGPSAPQRCSPELLSATMQLARERGLVWHTHVLETKSQAYTCREWHGRTFVELLEEAGLLGPQTTLAHTVWLTDHDIELMSSSATRSVHCLASNFHLGSGVASVPRMLGAGVQVALGTDGRGCDQSLDMFELTKWTALVHKSRGGDYRDWLDARQAMAMATTVGSACAGHGQRLGRIEQGARGDLVLLRRGSLALTPLHDPVRQLLFGAASRDVHTVVVDGRVVVECGQPTDVDLDSAAERVRRYTPEVVRTERPEDADVLEQLISEMYADIDGKELDIDSYIRT